MINSWSDSSFEQNHVTALHLASKDGLLEVVRWLVECGADVNSRQTVFVRDHYESADSVLHLAVEGGYLELVEYLVGQGADVDYQMNIVFKLNQAYFLFAYEDCHHAWHVHGGKSPLQCASDKGLLEIVHYLVEQGANVNAARGHFCDLIGAGSALHFASRNGHLEVAKCLIEHGADVNASLTCFMVAEEDGESFLHNVGSALHLAVMRDHLELVEYLVGQGADIKCKAAFSNSIALGSHPLVDRFCTPEEFSRERKRGPEVANFLGRVAALFDYAVDLSMMELTSGPFFLRDTHRRAAPGPFFLRDTCRRVKEAFNTPFHVFVGTILCASRFRRRPLEDTVQGAATPLSRLPAGRVLRSIAQYAGVPLRSSGWVQVAAEARHLGLL